MALFNKLFSTHKRKNPIATPSAASASSAASTASAATSNHQKNSNCPSNRQFPFSADQVRILLYRECDWRGRLLLFDSTAVQTQPATDASAQPTATTAETGAKKSNHIDTIGDRSYRYQHHRSTADCEPAIPSYHDDCNQIGEMVFGSIAIAVRSTALKVHWLDEPMRFVCSQVFVTPVAPAAGNRSSTAGRGGSPADAIDTSSLNSFSLSVSVCSQTPHPNAGESYPLDVPRAASSAGAYSDSGYGTGGPEPSSMSSCNGVLFNRSARSSFGSVFSDRRASSSRKFSTDSTAYLTDHGTDGSTTAAETDDRFGGARQRRLVRHLSTSLETRAALNDCVGFVGDTITDRLAARRTSDDQQQQHSVPVELTAMPNPSMRRTRTNGLASLASASGSSHRSASAAVAAAAKRSKLGLVICIRLSNAVESEMQQFCAEHIALLEAALCRLRAAAESAYSNRKRFYAIMLHAWLATGDWLTDLFRAPRLAEPVWLTLSARSSAADGVRLSQRFMRELCALLNCADTKDTNFFVSTLLTAVLTHHLGWVATVAPTAARAPAQRTALSAERPYNVLWAQLSDLYGSIGSPPKCSRTVVCGRDETVVGRLLNVLTYFIRCGRIERSDGRAELFDKSSVDDILDGFVSAERNAAAELVEKTAGSLKRTATCRTALDVFGAPEDEVLTAAAAFGRKNDIPNVLIFRDSRFVRQELRIGNHLMDTGIEMTEPQRQAIDVYRVKPALLVTGPQPVADEPIAEEAVEAEEPSAADDSVLRTSPSLSDMITANYMGGGTAPKCRTAEAAPFVWGVEPIKEGMLEEQWQNLTRSREQHTEDGGWEATNSTSASATTVLETGTRFVKSGGRTPPVSGASGGQQLPERMMRRTRSRKCLSGGDEPHPTQPAVDVDGPVFADDDAADGAPVRIGLKSYPSLSDLITANSCGASERLTWGIEPVKESVTLDEVRHFENSQKRHAESNGHVRSASSGGVVFVLGGDNETLDNLKPVAGKPADGGPKASRPKTCSHKKHSGVKFNFEKYPQIATNYMKNKNIDLAHYDFTADKARKLADAEAGGAPAEVFMGAQSTADEQRTAQLTVDSDSDVDEAECKCCAGNATRLLLQTPSNATELEFSNDDRSYPPTSADVRVAEVPPAPEKTLPVIVCPPTASSVKLIRLPLSGNERRPQAANGDGQESVMRPAGFIPSLFVGITDHYVADMVLQGTTAPQPLWEHSLKQNLSLAAHCATVEPRVTENVAILGNTDKWDVSVVSSQTYVLPCGSGTSGPIGMSQLVAGMLETVQAMWSAGLPAAQCMAYIEAKLLELYMQSETLAAFLLATEFCSLSTVTAALNVSANDVPLLLSVASVHSPQVTRKYGVSFR